MWLKKQVLLAIAVVSFSVLPEITMAASVDSAGVDINTMIRTQEQILNQLTEKKNQQRESELTDQIKTVQQQIAELKNQYGNYDSQGAISALAAQITGLQEQLDRQLTEQNKIIKGLQENQEKQQKLSDSSENGFYGTAATNKFLVNPGPSPTVGFTQDAINAQGDSTMVFSYTPSQLYKIYCKVGYLTDLQFKKGEKISFVGGGDTAKWMIDSAEADGIAHLYIKPINTGATTNLIINTTKHTYQVIANSGDWYNPMVKWSYSSEEQLANKLQQDKDDKTYAASLNITNPEQLNFGYEIKGKAQWKPVMVFDDGSKTYLQFDKLSKKMPILFIKEENKKEVSLVNYRVKDNYYIVDKIFTKAQLRVTDKETVDIIANRQN